MTFLYSIDQHRSPSLDAIALPPSPGRLRRLRRLRPDPRSRGDRRRGRCEVPLGGGDVGNPSERPKVSERLLLSEEYGHPVKTGTPCFFSHQESTEQTYLGGQPTLVWGIGLAQHVQRFLRVPCPLGGCGKSGVVVLLTNKTERNQR